MKGIILGQWSVCALDLFMLSSVSALLMCCYYHRETCAALFNGSLFNYRTRVTMHYINGAQCTLL